MAPISNNTTTQPKVWVNGQYVPAEKSSDGSWYVEIDGKRVKVDPNDLFGMNSCVGNDGTEYTERLVKYYDKLLTENEEKKDYLEAMGNTIKSQLKAAKEKYDKFMCSIGVYKISEIKDEAQRLEARELRNDISDLGFAKIANSNRYYSACMTSFDYALEKGNWQNQQAMA